jgi:hypothetical protein
MRRAGLIVALPLLFLLILASVSPAVAQREGRNGTLVIETGKTDKGKTLYSVRVDGADIQQTLKLLFTKSGEEFSIAPEVKGTLTFAVKNATMEQVFEQIVESANPPVKIKRDGKVWRVTRDTELEMRAAAIRERMQRRGGGLSIPLGYSQIPTDRIVNLDIPEGRAISFAEALQIIGQQTQIPVRLDKSIPGDVRFSGRFVQTPFPVVLESITKTGYLKWISQPDGSILIAPTDRWQLHLGGAIALGYPAQPCARCRVSLLGTWNYCPHCGQALPRKGGAGVRRNR